MSGARSTFPSSGLGGLLLALLLAIGSPALGQSQPSGAPKAEPEIGAHHLALARDVLLASGMAPAFDAIVPAVSEQIKKHAVARPHLAKEIDEVLAKIRPEMEMQKQRMIDEAARIYARALSEAELREIVAFFRTPAGQHYGATQAELADDLAGALQDGTQDLSEEMLKRVRAELEKRGHTLP